MNMGTEINLAELPLNAKRNRHETLQSQLDSKHHEQLITDKFAQYTSFSLK